MSVGLFFTIGTVTGATILMFSRMYCIETRVRSPHHKAKLPATRVYRYPRFVCFYMF